MNLRKYINWAMAAVLILLMTPAGAGSLDILPLSASHVVATGLKDAPGAVAWSPHGDRLAYIKGRRLIVEDVGEGGRIVSPVKGVYFVRWCADGTILALRRKGSRSYAVSLDAMGGPLAENALPVFPMAAYPIQGFGRLLLTSESAEEMKIGLNTKAALYVFDTSTGGIKEVFSADRIHPRNLIGKGFVMGWSGAGPSPIDETMILVSYKDPPALNPYVKAVVVDYLTGSRMDIYRAPARRLMPGASWSPLGDRVAVPGDDGRLRIIELDGESRTLDEAVTGHYAAWSPTGRRICYGGMLMYNDGSARRSLTGSDAMARCYWHPDGHELAVLSQGALRLYADPLDRRLKRALARPGQYRASKARMLRDLYGEGLIGFKEYEARFRKLMGFPEDVR